MNDTALEISVSSGKLALTEGKSYADVLKALTSTEVSAVQPFPKLPKPVAWSDDFHEAYEHLPLVFGAVEPSTRRMLEPEELAQAYDEDRTLQELESVIKKRREALKEYVRNHLDVRAETTGQADAANSPRDSHGHYVLGAPQNPEVQTIPGSDHAWTREYRSPKIDATLLERLKDDGEISRDAYMAFTKPARVLDPERVMKAVKKDPTMLTDLAVATNAARPGSALQTR